ncbi:hypothetical protein EGR_09403 [Echinococcus granulosus]|uniref:Uncharacterized protein n=1 Tax=Echinococcus granulosus TaxID=6210 RepID=W6U3R0_ECHGR|nr:hypothetical protein EGR_09403 [Echinococcus granulosus]EUB55745.1 hypothetical protein EGR_09403 [Echinococcus granulosus]
MSCGEMMAYCVGACLNAQISSIKGDARIIRGPANSFFTLQAVLPDVYKVLLKIILVRPYHALVTLAGKISKDLRWITFLPKRTYVIGVSIAVFPDDVWTPSIQGKLKQLKNSEISYNLYHQLYFLLFNHADGLIPDPNKPFFIDALGMTSVKLTCTFSGIGTPQENTLTTYEITVEKRFRIDYIGCTDGVNWITYMIEWGMRIRYYIYFFKNKLMDESFSNSKLSSNFLFLVIDTLTNDLSSRMRRKFEITTVKSIFGLEVKKFYHFRTSIFVVPVFSNCLLLSDFQKKLIVHSTSWQIWTEKS